MEIARLYRDVQRSFVELVADLDADQWALPSPCTPEWTVRDVLSHVAGVSIDIVDGNVEGAATDPWTAAQVGRWRDTPVDELIERWNTAIGPAADGIEAFGQPLPIFDCHSHEHDVRTAVGRPGNRDSEAMNVIVDALLHHDFGRPLTIDCTDRAAVTNEGEGESLQLSGVTGFEVARSRLGRRSRRQVESWDWSESIGDDVFAAWFRFGPNPVDIVE